MAKFRVKCTNDSGAFLAADDVIEYSSDRMLECSAYTPKIPKPIDSQLDAMLAAIDSEKELSSSGDRESRISSNGSGAYAFIREGAKPPRSSFVFIAVIAIAVIAMSIVALAVLVPHGDWALIQG